MAFDLGTLIRAAAMGGTAYQQAQRDQEDRTRQQKEHDRQVKRQKAADARAAKQEERESLESVIRLKALQEGRARSNRELVNPFRLNFRGVQRDYNSMEELLADQARLASSIPDPNERDGPPDAPTTRNGPNGGLIEWDPALRSWRPSTVQGGGDMGEVLRASGASGTSMSGRLTNTMNEGLNDEVQAYDNMRRAERNEILRDLIVAGMPPEEAEVEATRRLGRGP